MVRDRAVAGFGNGECGGARGGQKGERQVGGRNERRQGGRSNEVRSKAGTKEERGKVEERQEIWLESRDRRRNRL